MKELKLWYNVQLILSVPHWIIDNCIILFLVLTYEVSQNSKAHFVSDDG